MTDKVSSASADLNASHDDTLPSALCAGGGDGAPDARDDDVVRNEAEAPAPLEETCAGDQGRQVQGPPQPREDAHVEGRGPVRNPNRFKIPST